MNISCNIIRDLLPSYLDEICSEESKNAVEEHIATCESCREQFGLMKNELTSEKTEQQQLQYMKKVKRHYQTKGIGLFIFLIAIVCSILIPIYHWVPMRVYFVTLPIFIAAAYIILPKDSKSQRKTKQSAIFILISIILVIYSVVFFLSVFQWAVSGEVPFGLEAYELGPFCVKHLTIATTLQFILLGAATIQKYRGFMINRIIYPSTITASYIVFTFISLLRNMADPKFFMPAVLKNLLPIVIEGIITTIIIYVIIFVKNISQKKQ